MRLTYVGPHDAVEVPVRATGQLITVARGATEDLPAEIAEGLLEQGRDHWRKAGKP